MAGTPNRFVGPRFDEELVLEQENSQGEPVVDPVEEGGMTYHDGGFALKDSAGVFNPRTGAAEKYHDGYFDFQIQYGESDHFGVVTGLPNAPTKILGWNIIERDAAAGQSGYTWAFTPYTLTADGFEYMVNMAQDEFWPGNPGPVTLRVFYQWSS